jgi:hypothetical protein
MPPHPSSWRSILILSSHPHLVSHGVSFPQVSPPKPCTSLSPPPSALHVPPISFFSILSPKQYWVSTYHKAPHYVICSTPLSPRPCKAQILLNTLFSNTLSLRSSLNVSDQVSHPYKTTGKNMVLQYTVLTFKHHIFPSTYRSTTEIMWLTGKTHTIHFHKWPNLQVWQQWVCFRLYRCIFRYVQHRAILGHTEPTNNAEIHTLMIVYWTSTMCNCIYVGTSIVTPHFSNRNTINGLQAPQHQSRHGYLSRSQIK